MPHQFLFRVGYSIPWDNCAGICTDGTAACTGFRSGAVKRIQERHQMLNGLSVFFTKRPLQQKKLSPELYEIFNFVVKMRGI